MACRNPFLSRVAGGRHGRGKPSLDARRSSDFCRVTLLILPVEQKLQSFRPRVRLLQLPGCGLLRPPNDFVRLCLHGSLVDYPCTLPLDGTRSVVAASTALLHLGERLWFLADRLTCVM